MLPPAEAARLGLPCHALLQTPSPRHTSQPITLLTSDSALLPVPATHLPLLRRFASALRLFCKWRALAAIVTARGAGASTGGPECVYTPPEGTCSHVPVAASAYALRTLLELADIAASDSVMGGAAGKQALLDIWRAQVHGDASLLGQVRTRVTLVYVNICCVR